MAEAATPRLPLPEWAARYCPSYFTCPPSLFHRWLLAHLATLHARRGVRQNVVAPRGAAKSTWVSFAYPLWAAVHGHEPYVLLLSDTNDQAHKYLESIKLELEGNGDLARDYPGACGEGPVWRQDRIRLRNGVLIEALGTGAKIRGRKNRDQRPTLVIGDDLQNNEHITSPVQRQRTWEWLSREVAAVGTAATNFLILGTALHREGIVCRLAQTPGWRSDTFRAVVEWPPRMDLWREWEGILQDWGRDDREAAARRFYEANRAEMDAGAVVLWPEREPLYDLMTLRAAIGTAAFESEKQGSPTNPEACEWPDEYFDWPGIWFDSWPDGLAARTMALDPSKGADARHGDYAAWTMYGVDRRLVEYVESVQVRADITSVLGRGVELMRLFKPDGVFIEINQWQELLRIEFERQVRAAGLAVTVHAKENHAKKEVRIRRHTPYLAQRRVRLKARSPGTQLMLQQARDFPVGDHDDGLDSWEMARRLAIELQRGGKG